MGRKIAFFDIDGTLVPGWGREILPESALRAIRTFREKGNLAFVNTGRVLANVSKTVRDIGFDGLVCCGGGYIQCGEEVLYNFLLPHEECRRIALAAKARGLTFAYERYDVSRFGPDRRFNMPPEELARMASSVQSKWRTDYDDPGFVFSKFYCWADDARDIYDFVATLDREFTCYDHGINGFEVAPSMFSKSSGLLKVLDYYGIPKEDAYAFGDDLNDIDMLRSIPNGIVMGDSILSRQGFTASFTTTAVEEGGIEHALSHYGLI